MRNCREKISICDRNKGNWSNQKLQKKANLIGLLYGKCRVGSKLWKYHCYFSMSSPVTKLCKAPFCLHRSPPEFPEICLENLSRVAPNWSNTHEIFLLKIIHSSLLMKHSTFIIAVNVDMEKEMPLRDKY